MTERSLRLDEGQTEYDKPEGYDSKKTNTELKNRIHTIIKSNSIQLSECVKDGNEFTAMGITFSSICIALKKKFAGGNLERFKLEKLGEIKRELINLESEGIVEYLWGEPPYYILKDTIKYHDSKREMR